ncbi:MAG: hypothetical protein HY288_07450 [Planctomycetia bacterium]|nr:hypothetical protein [Planctomycetia bacterium]
MSKKFNRPMTAAEAMAILKSDPDWVRQNEERETRHKADVPRLQAELEPEQSPLIADLAAAGVRVSSVWDLVNTRMSYPAAIPVLTKYLGLARHPVLRQGIARALTVPEARGIAGPKLLEELLATKDPPGSEARWAMANALAVVADKGIIDEIRSLVADARYDDVHERLITALKNLRAG